MAGMDQYPLEGQIALVTGASRGLGRGMALGLASAGAHVLAAARTEEALLETVRLITAEGGSASHLVCDVTSEASVVAMAARIEEEHGHVDVLVNNAGVAWERPFADLSLEEFRDTLDVNVIGPFLVSQKVGRLMTGRGSGKIINIGSLDALVGAPNLTHYCASKGGVVQLTRALAAEWAKYGVTVNCLCPGYFPTDINLERLNEPKIKQKILGRIPLRRFGAIEEIVSWVVFMATSGSDYMTGQVVTVDGGETAR